MFSWVILDHTRLKGLNCVRLGCDCLCNLEESSQGLSKVFLGLNSDRNWLEREQYLDRGLCSSQIKSTYSEMWDHNIVPLIVQRAWLGRFPSWEIRLQMSPYLSNQV